MRQRGAGVIRRGCERAAEHIRNSAGAAHCESGKGGSAGTPWPRLLLWVFACAALLVSLVIRADGLDDRDPGLALRAGATKPSWETSLPVFSWTVHAKEGDLSPRGGPKS